MTGSDLLGRAAQLAELERALSGALGGRGSVLLLSGEPGIGKTRLVEELSRLAAGRGARVHWGRAWEAAGAPAGWPWQQLLRSLAPDAPLANEALALLAVSARPAELEAEQPRFELASLLVAVLEAACAAAPQLLVFDDLHAMDGAALALLALVAREARRLPLLIAGTFREAEARAQPAVIGALSRLSREGLTLPLGRLDAAAVSRLVEARLGFAPPAPTSEAVFRATEGNPLFVDAMARLIASRGELPQRLPDTIRETLAQQLRLLGPSTRALFEVAAVLGRETSAAALQRASGATAVEVSAALDEARGAGVAADAPSGAVRFAHLLIREALYQELPAARRAELHARCAETLEALDADPAELAHHARAGAPRVPPAKAHAWSLRAGEHALALLAFDDAAAHFRHALEALEAMPGASDAARAAVLCRLGETELRSGRFSAGAQTCSRAEELARRAQAPELVAEAALAMGAELTAGRPNPELARLLEAALELLPASRPALRARLQARAAAAQMPSPEAPRLLASARAAISDARGLGDPKVLAQVISSARSVYTPNDDLLERITLDSELAELARKLGQRHLALQAHARLVLDHVEQGDGPAVEAHLELCDALAAELRHPMFEWRVPLLRLMWSTLRGDAARVEALQAQLREVASRLEAPAWRVGVEVLAWAHARSLGRLDAQDAAVAALDAAGAPPGLRATVDLLKSLTLLDRGRAAQAEEHLAQLPAPIFSGIWAVVLSSEVYAATGNRPPLERAYAQLSPYAERNVVAMAFHTSLGPVALALGRIAGALGRQSEARAHFEAALELAERLGSAPCRELARAQLAKLGGAPVARPAAAVEPELTLAREGETWAVGFAGSTVRLKHGKGVAYLAELVKHRGRELHVSQLLALEGGEAPAGDAGELLDAKARAAYERRLEDLDDTLAEAEAANDPVRAARARAEREALADELARAVGLGGRSRRAADASERTRINVQRRLRNAIERIREVAPGTAAHLDAYVRTGAYCSYRA